MFNKICRGFFAFALVIGLSAIAFASDDNYPTKKNGSSNVKLSASPWGPSQAIVDAARLRVERSRAVQNVLRGTKYRVMGFEYVDNADETTKTSLPPVRFRTIFYDYTNDRTFVAEADFAGRDSVRVTQEAFDPGISSDEREAAIEILKSGSEFAARSASNSITFYAPMPPISIVNGERLVNIGVRDPRTGENQIVGVSFKNSDFQKYANNAPPITSVPDTACGVPASGQSTISDGSAAPFHLTVTQGPNTLWDMLVFRPSASSGGPDERSGLEIRDVSYKGKSVLKRGHAPILNVKYDANFCGPYRDWQNEEGMFNAPAAGATDVASGVRILASGQVATTVVETGDDTGNYRGVAIYRQGTETVLVTEMEAGWYRYIMEWRFADDGTIRPRYGFGSTLNGCVCQLHFHHVYWRFDLDIVTPINNVYRAQTQRTRGRIVTAESALFRDYSIGRQIRVQSSIGPESYSVIPNQSDGHWNDGGTTFGAGDFWLLRFHSTAGVPDEINDPNSTAAANLAPWLNGESLVNQDIVVWYAAHFTHSDGQSLFNPNRNPDVLSGDHVVGPDLIPVNW